MEAYSKYPDNLMIIDKLSLVLLKALNKDAAMMWLRERQDALEKTYSVSPNAHKANIEKNAYRLNAASHNILRKYDLLDR